MLTVQWQPHHAVMEDSCSVWWEPMDCGLLHGTCLALAYSRL